MPAATQTCFTNVYEALGFPNADQMKRKSELVSRISLAVKAGDLTHVQVAEHLGVGVGLISSILRGHFDEVEESRLESLAAQL